MQRMEKFIGSHMRIDTGNGFYEGIVKRINEREKELVLKQVRDCQTGEMMKMEQKFYGDQLKDLELLSDITSDRPDQTVILNGGNSHCTKTGEVILDASDAGSSLFQMKQLDPSLYLSGFTYCDAFLNDLNEPPNAVVVEKMDSDFAKAISSIKNQKVVSLAVEGRNISRFGEISVLFIGTRQMVYIFDVVTLGKKCFQEGISSILEDANLLKVVHDVRMISDCLHSIYHVKPKNIFDTQVADAFIYKQSGGSFPQQVSSLTDCVTTYLNVHPNDCTFERDKQKLLKVNNKLYDKRPLDKEYLKVCAKATMFVRELRPIMLERLLAEYLCGVDLYLDCVRDMPNNAVKMMNQRRLPKDFKRLPVKRRNHAIQNRRIHRRRSEDESHSDSCDESLKRRSAWDSGRDFNDKYQEIHGEIVECMDSRVPLIDKTKPVLKTSRDAEHHVRKESSVMSSLSNVDVNRKSQELQSNCLDQNKQIVDKKIEARCGKDYYDEFQMSTSESDDSSIYLTYIDDAKPEMSFEKPCDRPRITPAAKRMIRNSLGQLKNFPSETKLFEENTSSRSSVPFVNETDFPSLGAGSSQPLSSQKISWNREFHAPKGVNNVTKPNLGGRGHIHKMLSEQHSTKPVEPAAQRIISNEREAYDFPSDDELMITPRIAPMVEGGHVVGEKVKVRKKFMC